MEIAAADRGCGEANDGIGGFVDLCILDLFHRNFMRFFINDGVQEWSSLA